MGFEYVINIFFLCFSLMFRMFSKSARSRSNVCCWAVCVKAGSSSSSTSRHRGAPVAKAWTSWISPPPQQTSAMSTCEPPEGAAVWDLQKKLKKSVLKKVFVKAEKKEQKKKNVKNTSPLKDKRTMLASVFVLFWGGFFCRFSVRQDENICPQKRISMIF